MPQELRGRLSQRVTNKSHTGNSLAITALQLDGNMLQRVDLHVHSLHSSKPYSWFLRSLKTAECYTRVAEVHRIAHARGMTAVTISDHDTIDGALELCANFPDTFVSEEVSARFPEDGCVVHTIAVDITEAQHREIQRLRRNIYELVPYMVEQGIPYFWCHPLSHVNSRLKPWHLQACFLMFRLLEARNGTRATAHEEELRGIVGRLTPEVLARLAAAYPQAPWMNRDGRYGLVGGSDDHGALGIARAHTEYDGEANGAGIRAALHALAVTPGGESGTGVVLAHNAYGVAAGTVRSSGQLGSGLAEQVLQAPAPERGASSSMMRFLMTMQQRFKAAGGSFAEIWRRGHCDEQHHELSSAAETALVRQWKGATQQLADELRGGRLADAADVVPELLKLTIAELPYLLSYRYFGRDRREARELSEQLFPEGTSPWKQGGAPRVAIVADTTDETNGVAIGLARLVETARRLGYPLELIGPTTNDRVERPRPGLTRIPGIYAHQLAEYPSMTWCIPHLPSLLRFLCDEQIELVQVATPGPMGVVAMLAGRLLGLPVIGQYHTDVPRYAQHLLGDPTAAQMVERFVLAFYRSLDAVLVPSQFTARDLIAKGLDASKVHRIQRGVPLEDLANATPDSELRPRLGLESSTFLVLYVGRVSREKNLEAALAGFARALVTMPQAHLVIVGDGPQREELVARGLPNVHLLGEVHGAALHRLYATCDVFLFPSETDTFANAVVEAISAGLPVITAAGSAAAEHCSHGVNGFCVDISNADEIAMRLAWLLQNPVLRARMAHESRALSRRYDLTEAAHGLFERYAVLLAPKGATVATVATVAAVAARVTSGEPSMATVR
jgi:glycosyltransferase involved in cell wall biosynthesis